MIVRYYILDVADASSKSLVYCNDIFTGLRDIDRIYLYLEIYEMMLADKRYGLSVNLIATKVLPLLIPQMVNPQIQYENFVIVHSVLQEMFDVIDRYLFS